MSTSLWLSAEGSLADRSGRVQNERLHYSRVEFESSKEKCRNSQKRVPGTSDRHVVDIQLGDKACIELASSRRSSKSRRGEPGSSVLDRLRVSIGRDNVSFPSIRPVRQSGIPLNERTETVSAQTYPPRVPRADAVGRAQSLHHSGRRHRATSRTLVDGTRL